MTYEPETLHDDLREGIVTTDGGLTLIHTPFHVGIYTADQADVASEYNALLNQSHAARAERYHALVNAGQLHEAVFAVERPYRTLVLDELAADMNDETYWRTVAAVWIDQENPEDYTDEWRARFNADRPGREAMMEPDERSEYDALPGLAVIYRAALGDSDATGLSWTRERKVAEWFARRYRKDEPLPVYAALVARSDIAAYWTRRGEYEVLVVDPAALRNVRRA